MPTDDPDNASTVKRALVELRRMRSKLGQLEHAATEPIAIIGIGCRFPGASNPAEFWNLLHEGRDAIAETPLSRWDAEAFYDPDPAKPGKIATRWGGFIGDVDRFDPLFFGIAPREAASMDPQQRLLLEVAWEALEDAGIAPDRLRNTLSGVFVGIGTQDYLQMRMRRESAREFDAYLAVGSASHSVASGRLAYFFGLQGPCLSVDTACSSSLVSAHLACQSLRNNECRLALAGGVNLTLSPENTISLSNAGMMAADGRCKTFDAAADGFVRAEGCGILILKRVSDAVADGDRIYALIRGSAVNQDGRSNGLTAPNGAAQEAVLRAALRAGQVDPLSVTYVEAHGTGTALGDPIEVRALGAVYCARRPASEPLTIGSVKTNIGHAEGAAGVASLIKVALALKHGEIPPHLHFRRPTPHIAWSELALRVPTAPLPWPQPDGRSRLAGVSSFGFSGTNAHLVLEQAPPVAAPAPGAARSVEVLTLSARTPPALRLQAGRLAEHLVAHPDLSVGDVCHTANVGRASLEERLTLVGGSTRQFADALRSFRQGEASSVPTSRVAATEPPDVAFLFTGHEVQYAGMGRELYRSEPAFRAAFDACDAALAGRFAHPLAAIFDDVPPPGFPERPDFSQPALFALEWALAQMWQAWGVKPAAVFGHGTGEYAAAAVAGILGFEQALGLVARRGELLHALAGEGAMLAVLAPREAVEDRIRPRAGTVAIAAVNAPEHVVISGPRQDIERLDREFSECGVKTEPIPGSRAIHSSMMDPLLDQLEQAAAPIPHQAPKIGFLAATSGEFVGGSAGFSPGYWRQQTRQPVQFLKGLETLLAQGIRIFLEIGPHPVLISAAKGFLAGRDCALIPSLDRRVSAEAGVREGVAALYRCGAAIDWRAYHRNHPGGIVALPTYPWERDRYWLHDASAPDSAWVRAVEAGRQQAEWVPSDLAVAGYGAKWECLNRLALEYMSRTLQSLGGFRATGDRFTCADIIRSMGVVPAQQGLVQRWLDDLAEAAMLRRHGTAYEVQPLATAGSLEALLGEANPLFGDASFLLEYVTHCGDLLPAILTGRESPLETLFPGGSFTTTDNLYRHWALARYFNGIAGAVMRALSAGRRPDQEIRVLEIGAGTGGTSASLLPVLDPDRSEYHYTDVSDLFLGQARVRFGGYPFVRYGRLDIEKDPRAQGFRPSRYDVVVAANALHATKNLHTTLEHVKDLLAPGGILLLWEIVEHPTWFDVTTGVIEGWQRFDDGLRQDVPILPEHVWREQLLAHGFAEVAAFPAEGSLPRVLGQRIILARRSAERSQPPAAGPTGDRPVMSVEQAMPEEAVAASDPAVGAVSWRERLRSNPGLQGETMVALVREQVHRVLRLPPSRTVDRRQRLMDLGVDSLMAVELRNNLKQVLTLERNLPATIAFDYPTPEAMAHYLLGVIAEAEGAGSPAPRPTDARQPPAPAGDRTAAAALENLSDEDVARMLRNKLSRKQS